MKTRTKIIIIGLTAVTLLVVALLAVVNGADPAAKLLRRGNGAYAEQAYLEALELYQNAQVENPELAQPYYNAANAFYREGQYEQALAQMQQALLYADADLAQHSYFNLGNSFYNAQDLGTAVQSYIQALLLNPHDADAKYNLELALNNQQQQEQQEQQQEQNQEQNQDQQEQDQNGEGQDQQDQQDQSGENGEQQNEQPQDGQEGDQQTDQQNDQQNGEQENEGQDDQPQDQQNQNGQPNQPNQNGQQPQPGQPGDQPGTQAGLQPGQKLSQEQAKQLLAAIAGNSKTLQEKLGQMLIVPGLPPAQDW